MPGRALHTRYVPRTISVPAGTTATVPQVTTVNLGQVNLDSIDLQIPAGHSGLTGIRFLYAGAQLLPFGDTPSWIIGDDLDRVFDFDLEASSTFQVSAYNTDVNDHSFYLRFRVSDLASPASSGTAVIAL